MRRQIVLVAVWILVTSMAVPALAEKAPAPAQAAAAFAANAPAPISSCTIAAQAKPGMPASNLGWELAPSAVACTPSPLCATPGACDADCKSRGARLGACNSAQCCICIWKI